VLAILTIGSVFQLMALCNFWAFLSLGRPDENLRFALLARTAFLLVVTLVSPLGLIPTVATFAGGLALMWFGGIVWIGSRLRFGIYPQLLSGVRAVALAAGAASLGIAVLPMGAGVPDWVAALIAEVAFALAAFGLRKSPGYRSDFDSLRRSISSAVGRSPRRHA